MLHLNNCATLRRDFGRLQRRKGGIKKQFKSNNKLVFLMWLEYVKFVRQLSCHIGCREYKHFLSIKPTEMGVSTTNSDKSHHKLLEDDVLFKVGKEWATAANAPIKDSEPRAA
jgi:hypothetical protein